LLLGGAVFQQGQLLVALVVFGIGVVGGVFAFEPDLRVGAVQQEQEVLGIGVVGVPAPPENLLLALEHFFLELVVVGGANFELHVQLGELLDHPVEFGLVLGRGNALVVVVQHQRFSGFLVAAVRVSGLGQQDFGVVDRAPHELAVDQFVRHRVHAGGRAVARAEQPARQRPVRRLTRLLREDAAVAFFPVDGDRQCVAQLAVFGLLLGRVALADHRIEPVEAQVPVVRLDAAGKAHAAFLEALANVVRIVGVGQKVGAPVGPLDLGHVQKTLRELGPQRGLVLLDVEHQLVEKRQGFAAVSQQACLLVAGHSFAGIGGTVVVGVARHHMAPVGKVFDHHERAGAHGPHVERQAVAGHAGLGVELVGLPRHGGGEGHRHPVFPLRILALDAHPKGVFVERHRAGERVFSEVQERLVE